MRWNDKETSTRFPFSTGKGNFPELFHALQPAIDTFEWWGVEFCFCRMTEADAPIGVTLPRTRNDLQTIRAIHKPEIREKRKSHYENYL
jgi:hypothetical protein